jgi:hypothetical protein
MDCQGKLSSNNPGPGVAPLRILLGVFHLLKTGSFGIVWLLTNTTPKETNYGL